MITEERLKELTKLKPKGIGIDKGVYNAKNRR